MVDNVALHDARVRAIVGERDAFEKETETTSALEHKSEFDR